MCSWLRISGLKSKWRRISKFSDIFFIFVCISGFLWSSVSTFTPLYTVSHVRAYVPPYCTTLVVLSVVVGWRINPIDLRQPITVFHNAWRCHSSMFAIINHDLKNALLCEWEVELYVKQHYGYGLKQELSWLIELSSSNSYTKKFVRFICHGQWRHVEGRWRLNEIIWDSVMSIQSSVL